MRLMTDQWTVAFRKKKGDRLSDQSEFERIPTGLKEWYADPFLFEYQGDIYLFTEYFLYKHGLGTIAYAKYDRSTNTFGAFKEIIREPYHLSYPLVFIHNDEIYMMPEASGSESLYVYKAKHFPDVWEKHAVLTDGIKLVDTTPFLYNGEMYAVTKKDDTRQDPMLLLKIDPDAWKITSRKVVTDDLSISRPGGKVYQENGIFYMVTQDCEKDYGSAMNLLSFSIDGDMNLTYQLLKKITVDAVHIKDIHNAVGTHTYNSCGELEVIDFKYPRLSIVRKFWILMRKLKLKK